MLRRARPRAASPPRACTSIASRAPRRSTSRSTSKQPETCARGNCSRDPCPRTWGATSSPGGTR
eukprot:5049932-Alexandrium_andersonii.AAC.1